MHTRTLRADSMAAGDKEISEGSSVTKKKPCKCKAYYLRGRRDLNSPPALNTTKKGGFGSPVSHMDPKIDPKTLPHCFCSDTSALVSII